MKLISFAMAVLLAVVPHLSNLHASPVHRWSFDNPAGSAAPGTVIADGISGAEAVVVGTGGTFTGSALTLPGTTSGNLSPANIAAYVDLPNGLVSSRSSVTIEVWATVASTRNWQRLVDFGKMNIPGMGTGAAAGEITPSATAAPGPTSSTDDLMLAANRGGTANTQRFAGRAGGAAELAVDSNVTITPGTEYHFAIVAEDGIGSSGANGSQIRWYLNGGLVQTRDLNFRLNAIQDVNNWLGRSQFSGDSQANISYNEVRIFNHAMTPQEIQNSRLAGADAVFGPPTTEADSVTVNHGGKVRIPVLANDSGYLTSTVEIVAPPAFGHAIPDSAGRILYAHTGGTPVSDSFTYRVEGAGGISTPTTVTVHFSAELRLENPLLNVPPAPPPTAYQFVNAFPSVTFNQPLCITAPPGETNRLFIGEKGGRIRVIPNLAAPTGANIFLNLPTLLSSRGETLATSSEQGLLGLAFHPNYAANGFFYVFYSVTSGGSTFQRVSRFTVQAGNINAANTSSEVILFQQAHTASNHNGGDLHFGPDGYLYIALGDGGGANDSQGRSQKIDAGFFSAIARIDVDRKPDSLEPNSFSGIPLYAGVAAYAIPADNPYIGATNFNGSAVNPANVRTELWAVGLRNPWRMSFDPETGELWCADVGQGAREEVNLMTKGGNYGWAYREGTLPGPRTAPRRFSSIDPIYEYSHGSGTFQGRSVTGGLVYRGSAISGLAGAYLFGDYVSGNIWALRRDNDTVTVERIGGQANVAAFGVDPSTGDVLLADLAGGRLMRLTAETPPGTFPLTLGETGLFADLADLTPAPGLVGYDINLPFWSDHALKRRWFTVPDDESQITWSRDGLWEFPTGQIWVKHFDMEMTEGDPSSRRRLETRLLVHGPEEFYGVSYQWNEEQTEATLAPDAGANLDLIVMTTEGTRDQRYRIPSRTDCMTCHSPQAGHALSFNTRQLNRTGTIAHMVGDQLGLLSDAGYFANAPEATEGLPRHVRPNETEFTLEARVRSYLDVNCMSCHTPGGSGGSGWDARASIDLFQTGLIRGAANNNGGNAANQLVVPGDPEHSILLHRLAATNGFSRMPPLATNEFDEANIALITEWILDFDPERMPFGDWQLLHFGSTGVASAAEEADPDGDGKTNRLEYLLGTLPLVAETDSRFEIDVSDDGVATVNYSLSPNAVGRVMHSTNLVDWLLWNVPGNDGLPRVDELRVLQEEVQEDAAFFRLLLDEH